jgi:hypothetical protein
MLLVTGRAAAQPTPIPSALAPKAPGESGALTPNAPGESGALTPNASLPLPPQASPAAAPLPLRALPPLPLAPLAVPPPRPLFFDFPYPPAVDERAHAYSWYGFQILIGEISADLTTLVGIGIQSGPVVVVGVLGRVTSAPIVHLGHRHPGRAAVSFAIEALVPGMALGAAALSPCSRGCAGLDTAMIALIPLSMGIGTIVDAAILSGEEADTPPVESALLRVLPLTVAPLAIDARAPVVSGRRAFLDAPVGFAIGARF